MSLPMSRQKNLATMALLTISGWAVQSTAFSIPNEYRLKRPAYFRSMETRTPLNLLLPSSPRSSMSKCPQKYMTTRMAAASTQLPPMADLAVRLDEPILSSKIYRGFPVWKSSIGGIVAYVFKTALIAFLVALTFALVTKLPSLFIGKLKPFAQSLSHGYKVSRGRVLRVFDERRTKNIKHPVGIPMDFSDEENATGGWGVCTLSSREEVGRSQFVKYEFDLPLEDNTLDLLLGQQVTLCYLDKREYVAKADYYLSSPRTSKGSFSILVPKIKRDYAIRADEDDNISPDFTELAIGDEIALKPGPETLQYRGQYFPVTDMVYFVAGEGIAPVIEQVKSVLPSGSSSVKLVKVVWMNESEKDFDVAQSTLEEDYYKYFKKLDVHCILEDFERNELDDNDEIIANVPRFNPGTMVVISGPRSFVGKAWEFLMETGYPDECICVFPSD
mmetsp:Transcript_6103/g.7094  ORF Transcript_6103/g.7094 Transcript_6103/m.7094 type:complete len:445 (+) Transcript_6103:123-1457(+)